jgi:hypothetical protein
MTPIREDSEGPNHCRPAAMPSWRGGAGASSGTSRTSSGMFATSPEAWSSGRGTCRSHRALGELARLRTGAAPASGPDTGTRSAGSGGTLTWPGRVFKYPRYPQAQDSVVRPWRSVPNWRGWWQPPQWGAPPSITIPARPSFCRDRFTCAGT